MHARSYKRIFFLILAGKSYILLFHFILSLPAFCLIIPKLLEIKPIILVLLFLIHTIGVLRDTIELTVDCFVGNDAFGFLVSLIKTALIVRIDVVVSVRFIRCNRLILWTIGLESVETSITFGRNTLFVIDFI